MSLARKSKFENRKFKEPLAFLPIEGILSPFPIIKRLERKIRIVKPKIKKEIYAPH